MSLFKSKRRRQAERAVRRAYELRDDAADRLSRGRDDLRTSAKRFARTAKTDARSLKHTAKADAQAAKRASLKTARRVKSRAVADVHAAEAKSARVGSNLAEMVRENPAASIGGALALAVAIGAGTTYWMRERS